jgi:hypothetical protein
VTSKAIEIPADENEKMATTDDDSTKRRLRPRKTKSTENDIVIVTAHPSTIKTDTPKAMARQRPADGSTKQPATKYATAKPRAAGQPTKPTRSRTEVVTIDEESSATKERAGDKASTPIEIADEDVL